MLDMPLAVMDPEPVPEMAPLIVLQALVAAVENVKNWVFGYIHSRTRFQYYHFQLIFANGSSN
jgi:hypothetical protein